ncbi:MAG TPA: DUF1858 domain-containing protein [Ignavibacteriaceae bacterium]|jgi:methionine synthase II (cobalamin-independent)|nr:DUF1858 domain-containing protein [Ignavibacteriaceae bacterium]
MENRKQITKETYIEELVEEYSGTVSYLMNKGIRCLVCGEPSWGTIESAAKEKGFSDEEIAGFVNEMNRLFNK